MLPDLRIDTPFKQCTIYRRIQYREIVQCLCVISSSFIFVLSLSFIVLVFVGCQPIAKPVDTLLSQYQPDGMSKPLESYRLKYDFEPNKTETMTFEFAWVHTPESDGFDAFSDGTYVATGGAISEVDFLIDDLLYEWVGADPVLGAWSVKKRTLTHPIAMPPGRIFDFDDPQTLWSLPTKEILANATLVGSEPINGLMTHHYLSTKDNTNLWIAEDGGFVVKYIVSSGANPNLRIRSFELYDINQPFHLQPPVHAQWLVDAMTQGTIHFPGCEPCIFPVPSRVEGISRSLMTSGRDLLITTNWTIPRLLQFLEAELPKQGWEISKIDSGDTAQQLKVTDGVNHFVVSVSPSEPVENQPSINYLSIMPEDITYFPIVLEKK